MRWVVYFIFAYVTLGLQIGIAPFVAYQGASPNLALLAVIFIALNAPRDAALLGAFAIGTLQDLLSAQTPGLFGFSYGLVAMFVISTQHVIYRDHPLTHLSVTFVGGLMTMFVLVVHSYFHPSGARVADLAVPLPAIRISAATEFTRVLYTAALAPIVLAGLNRCRGIFAFQNRKRLRPL